MKKLLIVLAIGAFAACGGGDAETTDTTITTDTGSAAGTMATDTTTITR